MNNGARRVVRSSVCQCDCKHTAGGLTVLTPAGLCLHCLDLHHSPLTEVSPPPSSSPPTSILSSCHRALIFLFHKEVIFFCHQKIIVLATIQPVIWHWLIDWLITWRIFFSSQHICHFKFSSLPLSLFLLFLNVLISSIHILNYQYWEPFLKLSWFQIYESQVFIKKHYLELLNSGLNLLHFTLHCWYCCVYQLDWVVWSFATWAAGEGWALAWWLLAMKTGYCECALTPLWCGSSCWTRL